MNFHKLEILVFDFYGAGLDDCIGEIEALDCGSMDVLSSKSVDIGEWEETNPLNYETTKHTEVQRLFGGQ